MFWSAQSFWPVDLFRNRFIRFATISILSNARQLSANTFFPSWLFWYLSIYLTIYLYIDLPIYRSIDRYIYLSIYLSVYTPPPPRPPYNLAELVGEAPSYAINRSWGRRPTTGAHTSQFTKRATIFNFLVASWVVISWWVIKYDLAAQHAHHAVLLCTYMSSVMTCTSMTLALAYTYMSLVIECAYRSLVRTCVCI